MSLNKSLKDIKFEEVPRDILPVRQQPVRTTFRLSREAHDAIKHVSKTYRTKNTDIFDMIVSLFRGIKKHNLDLFSSNLSDKAVRKTYLINKSTLLNIEKIVKEQKTSRDIFIDFMASALKFACDKTLTSKSSKYKKVLEEIINPFWEQGEEIKKRLEKELGKDDPVTSGMEILNINIMNLAMAIEDYINKETPIEKNFP